jgi:hypothetical protein
MFWIILISGLAAVTFFMWKKTKTPSGLKLKIQDKTEKVMSTAKDIVDVNNDGKVNFTDVLATIELVESGTKRAVKSAKISARDVRRDVQEGKAKKKYGGKVKKSKSEG